SVVNASRNCPGAPLWACWVRRRPTPPVSVCDSLRSRSRSAHSFSLSDGGSRASLAGAAAAAGAAAGGAAGGVLTCVVAPPPGDAPPPKVTVPCASATLGARNNKGTRIEEASVRMSSPCLGHSPASFGSPRRETPVVTAKSLVTPVVPGRKLLRQGE